MFNPMTGVIEGFRAALFGLPFNWLAILISTVVVMLLLTYALFSFRRMEREFADIV
jgi:lipopolysaccharide transport system permease protein